MISSPISLEKTIFRLSCFLAVIYELYALGVDIILPLPLNHAIVDFILLLLFSILSILSFVIRNPLRILQFPFVAILFLGIGYFWLESGGLRGGSIGYISMLVLMVIILVPSSPLNFYAAFLFLTMQTFFAILEVYQPDMFLPGENLNLGFFPLTFLILNMIAAGIVGLLKYMIDAERTRLNNSKVLLMEKNEKINAQNAELKQKGEHISKINQNLEKRVSERTSEIRFQKRQIEEFTYLNAHKLRGAISRIVGLSNLQKNESSSIENEKLSEMIDQSAREADEVLKEITTKLSEESKRSLED
jgi:signal transduction histidine kinase